MCGIVGYAGARQAAPILLEGLKKLEYRGYDSTGICVQSTKGLLVAKAKGRLQVLQEQIQGGAALPGHVGIGHTRWATHGAPSDSNSHPHFSDDGKIALVHNGIIENEGDLRCWLEGKGICFHSETDTEVAANLVGYYYAQCGDLLGAIRLALSRIRGSYALGILCTDLPETVVAVKQDSPLIFGFGERENFIASDVTAILKHTRQISYLDDGEMAVFGGNSLAFYDRAGEPVQKKREVVTWEPAEAERSGYDHFMLKEIFEQPKALRETLYPRLQEGKVVLEGIRLPLENLRRICFVACGSAYYVSVLAKYTFEKLCRIPVEAVMASEFRYGDPVVDERDLVIFISQSGETADTLAALREAKRRGARTLAVVNVVGSAIAKSADQTVYTWAGPEIAVATTKAFTAQLGVVYLLALSLAQELGTLPPEERERLTGELEKLPQAMEALLTKETLRTIQLYADRYSGHHDAFYIGRNLDSAVCLEGSLKLKEIAYLHSEAYPAGELKHGPISLIREGTLVVALATQEALFEKTVANIREVTARGADVLCLTLAGREAEAGKYARSVLGIPKIDPIFQPSLSLIPLQLFAYYVAVNRGCDVDKPRNLAKSVTVE